MKYLNYFMAFLGLFILDVLYSSIIAGVLNSLGIDILSFTLVKKCFCLILIDLSLMFIFYLIYRKELNKEFFKYIRHFKEYFSFGFKWWIIGLCIMIGSNLLIQIIYPSVANNEAAIQNAMTSMPLYIAFSSCLFAPFVEEIIFRKSLKKVFSNDFLFILMSGLFFGLIHNLTGLDSKQILYIIPYGAFGCVFAYMYTKTRTIFTSMTFHFIHNTVLVLISLYSMGVL